MIHVMTYEEFLKSRQKYDGTSRCFVFDCNKPALYEGGDGRFYCGMCEECANMEQMYKGYLSDFHIAIDKKLSAFDAYIKVRNKRRKLQKKIEEELAKDGPEFGKT